ncbi:MAG: isochorismatase hydrolase [Thermoleophilia bacterium]|nr:isochorismatase hydrolase [Thermoleophilia bacterium]
MTGSGAHARAALVIVDMQEGFARETPALYELADHIAAHVDTQRERYAFVAASQFRGAASTSYQRLVGDDMQADEDVALIEAIASRADFAYERVTYGKFAGPLAKRLADAGVDVLHVCGADTDQCVLATVFEAFDAGLTPVVLEDLCYSCSGRDPQEAGLIALRRAIGEPRVVAASAAFAAPLQR